MSPTNTISVARCIFGLFLIFLIAALPLKSHAALPGDCNSDLTVSIAEVQSAINMFLGIKPSEGCADTDNNTSVSIAEVQKAINSFLGITPPNMKGFWKGIQDTTGFSVIVLANGEMWLVLQEAGVTTRFARFQTQSTTSAFSGSGNHYLLTNGTTQTASSTGTFAEKSSLSGTMTTESGSTSFSLTYDSQYETVVSQNDAVGSWTGTYNGGDSSTTIIIDPSGALTGSSTTGCSYNGILHPRTADPAIFDLNFTETCVVGEIKILSGIATVNTNKTHLSFAATTADNTNGALFIGLK